MSTELKKFEVSDIHEKLQSGQLVIGLSSAIPGFIKEDPNRKAISFAPYYARDRWIDLPIAIIKELPPTSNGKPKEHLPVSFELKSGGKREKVLIDIIGALTRADQGPANGKGTMASSSLPSASENGICRCCKMGDEFCVDCYL
jgi:hypothetical protein